MRARTADTWNSFFVTGQSHLGHSNSPSFSGTEEFCVHRQVRVHRWWLDAGHLGQGTLPTIWQK